MKRKQELPVYGKDELNLAEFPFAVLSHRVSKNQKTIEYTNVVKGPNGKLIKQEWIVTGSDKYGLPTAIDNDVYIALMKIAKDEGLKVRRITFSRYQLIMIQGKDDSKREYDRIEQALNRLTGVTIYSKGTFWDSKLKCYRKMVAGTHLLDDFKLFDERPTKKNKDQLGLFSSYVIMSEELFNSIKNGYIKNLDLDFYFSLSTPLARRLYRYLDKKRYEKEKYEIRLSKLAKLLPINREYPSQIKMKVDRAHKELVGKGFLKNFTYRSSGNGGEEKVIYTFSSPPRISALGPGDHQSPYGIDLEMFPLFKDINQLFLKGVCQEFPIDQVLKYLDILQFQYSKSRKKIDSPEALLYSTLTNPNFVPPRDYTPLEEREEIKKQRELKEVQGAQERKEQEKEAELRRRANAILDTLKEEELKELEEQAREAVKEDLQEIKPGPLFDQLSKVLIRAQMVELTKARLMGGGE